MKKLLCYLSVLVILFIFAKVSFAEQEVILTESGLKYIDLEAGTGPTAKVGKIAVIHFIGWLDDNGEKGEEIFNSRRDREKPVLFKLGTDNVIKGWNIGVAGMKSGGKRRLMVPSALGCGATGGGDVIPPNADLIFDIELIEVK
jgi:FKBP-type peptidyl-prolyl cis-trans isomerase FkpA